jgi:PAS domain S-box-containing protein
VNPSLRPSRRAIAVAAVSLAAILLGYVAVPVAGRPRQLVADAALTWCAGLAAAYCLAAWRALRGRSTAGIWAWLAAGCAVWLLGQLAWDYTEVLARRQPGYPSLADVGFVGIYLCLLGAARTIAHDRPRRPAAPELTLDLLLVGFTIAALAYRAILVPLQASAAPPVAVLTSIGWSAGGIAVIWLLLREMLRRAPYPLAAAGLVSLGLGILSLTNIAYGTFMLTRSFPPGNLLDLGWVAAFLVIAVAASGAVARADTAPREAEPDATAGRAIALVLGLAALLVVAVTSALSSRPDPVSAVLIAIAVAITGVRFFYALRLDQRYAERLERDVAARTRRLQALMGAVPDVILVLDGDGRILETNLRFRTNGASGLQTPPEVDLLGRSVFDLLEPEPGALVRTHLLAALGGEVCRFEVPFRTAGEDATHVFSAVLAPVARQAGEPPKILALGRDITDQRRTEGQLQQAEKLAAMGRLVSGVAHEINNPAAIISGFAQILLRDPLGADHREMVQMVFDEATRIGRITQNLLAFARGGGRERAAIDLNDVARRTFALRAYNLSTGNVEVTLDLDPAGPRVWGNATQLQQTLLNLLLNAEHAVAGGPGPRRISCRTRGGAEEIRVDITDNGPGVPAEVRDRIFDPFFTTKTEGAGTGLGLSICYGIVREHGGRIWAEAAPPGNGGGGSVFCIALPFDARAQAPVPPLPDPALEPAADAVPPVAAGRLRVLLAEDEGALRRAAAKFLERDGITVHAVADGAAALDALAAGEFDVIVSDIRMPGVGGREFVARLRRDRPDLLGRLLFLTGDTLAADTASLLHDVGAPSLAKPFQFAALERLIRTIAGRHAPSSGVP